MIKILSALLSSLYSLIDFSFLHYIIYSAGGSGYVLDYIGVKGTHNVFRRLKKISTRFRRQ